MNYYSNFREPLPPHSYPLGIKIFLYLIAFGVFVYTPYFIIIEGQQYYECGHEIKKAQNFFKHKNFEKSFELYAILVKKYPEYTNGKIMAAKSVFSLINIDVYNIWKQDSYFQIGTYYLSSLRLSTKEIEDLIRYLPGEYKKKFKNLLK